MARAAGHRRRGRQAPARGGIRGSLPNARSAMPQPAAGRWRLVAAALLLATLSAYHPAWHGGLLWDDVTHVTSAELRSCTASGASGGNWAQPSSITADALGLLVPASTLGRRDVRLPPGQHLPAHVIGPPADGDPAAPEGARRRARWRRVRAASVHVESVAWIAELKNVLSARCTSERRWPICSSIANGLAAHTR